MAETTILVVTVYSNKVKEISGDARLNQKIRLNGRGTTELYIDHARFRFRCYRLNTADWPVARDTGVLPSQTVTVTGK